MTKIKAVIFDMDGVLIEAKEWHYEALNKALLFFGMSISHYDHITTYDGLPTKRKLEILTTEKELPKGLHPFISRLKQRFTVDAIQLRCKPSFNQQYALSNLKKEGYKIAVCSNSIRNTVNLMLQNADLLRYCEFFLSNEDVQNHKPHPEIYNTAIQRLGLSPQECLIVEDNHQGMKAALESGAHLLEVRGTDDVTLDNIKFRIQEIEAKG